MSGGRPAARDGVPGRVVIALECALLLIERVTTIQGLDLRRRNARRVSRGYVDAWALMRGLHGLSSWMKIENEGPGRR